MKTPTGGSADTPRKAGDDGKPLPRRTVLAAGVATGLAGCSATRASHHAADAAANAPLTRAVHLIARDWHTDIDLPADRLPAALLPLARDFPGAAHFLFGFGERAYWTRPDPNSADALAALIPGPGVILVTALRVAPPLAFPAKDVVVLPVSEEGLSHLAAFLVEEMREAGEFRRMADGPYPGSRFYATSRRYSAAYTCNTWTADALQVAGTGVTASGILFARQLMRHARAIATYRTPPAETLVPVDRTVYHPSADTLSALRPPEVERRESKIVR